jgi:hypothetical protein
VEYSPDAMSVGPGPLEGAFVLHPRGFPDERARRFETMRAAEWAQAGFPRLLQSLRGAAS